MRLFIAGLLIGLSLVNIFLFPSTGIDMPTILSMGASLAGLFGGVTLILTNRRKSHGH